MNKDLGFLFGCRLGDLFGIPTCLAKMPEFYQDEHMGVDLGFSSGWELGV